MAEQCPAREELVRHVRGALSPDAEEMVRAHLTGCERCRAVVGALLAPTASSTATPGPLSSTAGGLATGAQLERFVLLGELGVGGMGRVYAAWDPKLARRVALKVVRHEVLAKLETQREALMNEARAMAQLSHPNVVTVHDVFEFDGQLVIAMEYVEGTTLRLWAGEHTAPAARWAMLLEAGRGLAAAHEQGVLHRDFKPDNVLVSDTGRARVADFGLARFADGARDLGPSLAGTVGYLAPELLEGGGVDARVDQYAFAVTVCEVLTGEKQPTHPAVPAAVQRVLARALSRDPAARYPSLSALLSALLEARDLPRRRARQAVLAVASLTVVGLLGGVAVREQTACGEGARLAAAVLDDARATAITRAFGESGAENAALIAADLLTRTRARSRAWAEGWEGACRAARSEPVGARGLPEARMRCYGRALTTLEVATNEWTHATKETVGAAASALETFEAESACEEVTPESFLVLPTDPAAARELTAQRLRLDALRARSLTMSDDALEKLMPELEQLVSATSRPGAESVLTEAASLLAHLRLDRNRDGRELALVALRAALAVSDHKHASLAANAVALACTEAGAHEEALRWLSVSDGLAARLRSPRLDGAIEVARASVLKNLKRHPEAAAANRRALASLRKVAAPDSIELAVAKNNLAVAAWNLGEFEEARVLLEESLTTRRARLGAQHSALLAVMANLADLKMQTGQVAEGVALDQEVLARLTPVDGVPHKRRPNVLGGVAMGMLELGRADEAEAASREMLELAPVETELSARALRIRAEVLLARGEVAAAREHIERSLALHAKLHLEDPLTVGPVESVMADVLLASGARDEARTWLARAQEHLRPGNTTRTRNRLIRVAKALGPVESRGGNE